MMDESAENRIRDLLAAGNKIAAIQLYREATGAGLAEAKAAVESIEAGGSLAERADSDDSGLADRIVRLLRRDEKISAIRLYREQCGCSLKEAKMAVEQIGQQNGIHPLSGTGCLGVVLVGIMALAKLLV